MTGKEQGKKRTGEDRTPDIGPRTRRRLDEFDLGESFRNLSEAMRKEVERLLDALEDRGLDIDKLKHVCKVTVNLLVSNVEGVMNQVSDAIRQERLERESDALLTEDRLKKIEDKLDEQGPINDLMVNKVSKERKATSQKEMEKKVNGSMNEFKVLDINFGREIKDKKAIADMAVEIIREDVRLADRQMYDDICKKVRVSVLGTGTKEVASGQGTVHTVPILVSCKDRADKWDLEGCVRRAGYFPSFHWPSEMIDFVKEAREEVAKLGYDTATHFIRIRPGEYNGNLQIRADVKLKSGGEFRTKAVWDVPPLDHLLWNRYTTKPRVIGNMRYNPTGTG